MVTRRNVLKTLPSAMIVIAASSVQAEEAVYTQAAKQVWRRSPAALSTMHALQRELIRCATLAPNGHNTQPWKFRLRPSGIDIVPDLARRTPVVDPDDHHLWVSLGCATENLVQAAAALGQHADVNVTDTAVCIYLAPSAAQRLSLFEAITLRQSTRAEYDQRALSTAELQQLEQSGADEGVTMLLFTQRSQIDLVRDSVIAGNTQQMHDPAFITELKQWIRFSEAEALAQRDGLFTGASAHMSMPRWLGSTLFSLFVTTRGENDRYAAQLRTSAGVAVFAAERASRSGWVAAGRACERFLLQAAALDIRTAFVNQAVEVQTVRTQFAAAIGIGSQRPDLVVRFGHGPRLPQSLRRPVDAVLIA